MLVWREKVVENRKGEWAGPFTVKSLDDKSRIVLVQKDADSPLSDTTLSNLILSLSLSLHQPTT